MTLALRPAARVVVSIVAYLAWIAALLVAMTARADGVSCEGSVRAESHKAAADGAALEKSGKLVEAYAHYRAAVEYCDIGSASQGIERTGKALGVAAEKAGRGYGDARLGGWESRPHCIGKATPDCVTASELDALRGASAVAWYEATGWPGETDRIMLAHARAHADDLDVFKRTWSHFSERDGVGASTGRIAPGSGRAQLQQLASSHVSKLLDADAKEFATGPDTTGVSAHRCSALLDEARKWGEAAQLDASPVRARAVQHGDERMRGSSVAELSDAKLFYRFAEDGPKVNALRAKASAEGEKALAANQRMNAVQYFTVADDEARAEAAAPKFDVAKIQKPDPEKVKKLLKTDVEKEKFRKEQAELEKELGM